MNIAQTPDDALRLDAASVNGLLDCVPGPILLLRADGTVICVNAAAHALEAWIKSDNPSLNLSGALAPAMLARSNDSGKHTIPVSLRRSPMHVRQYQATMQRVSRDAMAVALSLVAERENDAQSEIAQARLEDVQRQLLQADRMSSIGQLAAGVAHEINNPIGYIQSNLGTLSQYITNLFQLLGVQETALRHLGTLQPDLMLQIQQMRQEIDFEFLAKDLPMLLTESQEGIARVRKIVQDLREFSRAGHAEAWVFADIHAGLESTINIVWNDLKYKVELVKHYGQLPLVECLPSQLNQVFMNILVNAGHAIEDRGQITIATRADEQRVYVEISDSGKGIAEEHLQRIFEPFFTTKPVGKGTGLGLSISYGIVQKHGGAIDVRSEPNIGTTFLITLPIRQPHLDSASATPRAGTDALNRASI
jgi:two-component system NtrC family sensor kinase